MRRLLSGLVLAVWLLMLIAIGNCDCNGGGFGTDDSGGDDDCFKAALMLPDECTESCATFFDCLSGDIPDQPELPQTLEECQVMCEDGDFLEDVFCSECVFTCWLNAPECVDAAACSRTCLDTTCQANEDDDSADDDSYAGDPGC
jgi:hypothetical protein